MAIDLTQLLPEPRKVSLGRGEAPVYGLNITQLSFLLRNHQTHIQRFLSDTAPDMEALIDVLPDLAVQLIAMGLRCEGQEEQIKTMPLATQIEVLMDVWELSVPDAKKLKARLSLLLEGAKSLAVNQKKAALPLDNPSPAESTSSSVRDIDSKTSADTPSVSSPAS